MRSHRLDLAWAGSRSLGMQQVRAKGGPCAHHVFIDLCCILELAGLAEAHNER